MKDNNAANEKDDFKNYETAVERTSWVRKANARVQFNGSGGPWENCSVELEQTGTQRSEVDFGTLSVFGAKNRHKEHLSLSEITCVCRSGEKTLAVHSATRSFHLAPLQIKFSGDLEMEQWQADITAGRNDLNTLSDFSVVQARVKRHPILARYAIVVAASVSLVSISIATIINAWRVEAGADDSRPRHDFAFLGISPDSEMSPKPTSASFMKEYHTDDHSQDEKQSCHSWN